MTQPSEQSNRDLQKVDASGSNNIQYVTQSGNIIIYGKNSESEIKLTTEELKDAVIEFLADVEQKFKYIKLFHAPQETVELTDQYIPIQVTLERIYQAKFNEKLGSYGETEEELKRIYAAKGEKFERQQEDWQKAKKNHQIIMVLADPGMGKSTLLKLEAVQLARQEIRKLDDAKALTEEAILNIIENLQFPLFLRLSDLIEETGEVIDNILSIIKRRYPGSAVKIEFLLREKLETGQCLLLLDALDEVEKEKRSTLQADLNPFINKFENKTICTSRIVGYSSFLNKGKEMEIVPFTEKQTEEYINVWFENAEAANVIEDDSVSAIGLINEIKGKPQIQGLTQNPLLLSLVCSLYQTKGLELPARKTQVYEQAVNYMLSQWSADNQRLINDDGWVDSKRELLEYLAYQFSAKQTEVFKIRPLRKEIDRFKKETESSDFEDKNASDLLKELSEQDGILQKLSEREDQYLFLHRTFQEYLAASYINEKIEEDEEEGIGLVKEKLWQFDWHETISLVAGLMSDPIPLLEMIRQEEDDMFNTLLLLSGSCLGECGKISDPLVTEIVEKIVKFWECYPEANFITVTIIALEKKYQMIFDQLIDILKNDQDPHKKWCLSGIITKTSYWKELKFPYPMLSARMAQDVYPRCRIERSYTETGIPIGHSRLFPYLTHENANIRKSVERTLGQNPNNPIEFHSILFNLKQALKYQDISILSQQFNLKKIDNINDLTVALIAILEDRNNELRWKAVWLLGEIGDSKATPHLIEALNDDDSDIRWRVPKALKQINDTQAIQALIKALNHDDSDVRWRAIEGLATIDNQHSKQAIEPLISLLNDEDEGVKRNATEALRKINHPDTLTKLLNNPDIDIYDSDIFQLARSLMIRNSDKIKHPVIRSQK